MYGKFIVGILPLHLLNGQRETSFPTQNHVLRVEYVQRWSGAKRRSKEECLKKNGSMKTP